MKKGKINYATPNKMQFFMACICGVTESKNTGTVCSAIEKDASEFFFMPMVADDGTANTINAGTFAFDQTAWEALTNHSDPSKRLYPVGHILNYESLRGEDKTWVSESEEIEVVSQGIEKVKFLFPNSVSSASFLAQIKEWGCENWGFFKMDSAGQFIGEEITAGILSPIAVQKGSLSAMLIKAKAPAQPQHLQVMFNVALSVRDERTGIIVNADMPYDPINLVGLYDASITYVSDTTTQVIFDLFAKKYGDTINKVPITGLLITHFFGGTWGSGTGSKLYNETDAAEITISSVTESTSIPGRYTIVFTPAQTSLDVMKVYPKRNGIDFTDVYASQFIV